MTELATRFTLHEAISGSHRLENDLNTRSGVIHFQTTSSTTSPCYSFSECYLEPASVFYGYINQLIPPLFDFYIILASSGFRNVFTTSVTILINVLHSIDNRVPLDASNYGTTYPVCSILTPSPSH